MEVSCARIVAFICDWHPHECVCEEEVNPPPPSHCITGSVAWYHHIKLVLMNTSESTEERDNQTFIK